MALCKGIQNPTLSASESGIQGVDSVVEGVDSEIQRVEFGAQKN